MAGRAGRARPALTTVMAMRIRSVPCIAALCVGILISGAHGARAHEDNGKAAASGRVGLSGGRSERYDYDPPAPGSYELPPIKPAADGRVIDSRGRSLSLHEVMEGHIVVLAFIYTRCSDPQGCPLSLGLLHRLRYYSGRDPEIGDNLRLIALSFDYQHDTPEVLAEHEPAPASEDDGQADLMFLSTASEAALTPILAAYDQPIGRKRDVSDPYGPFTHQLRIFLIDRQARIRNIYSLGFLDPRLVLADVRTLLLESRSHGTGQ